MRGARKAEGHAPEQILTLLCVDQRRRISIFALSEIAD
jgi:hypothetical protein